MSSSPVVPGPCEHGGNPAGLELGYKKPKDAVLLDIFFRAYWMPSEVVDNVKGFLLIDKQRIPVPWWVRCGPHPLNLASFREAILDRTVEEAVNVELEGFRTDVPLTVEVVADISSTLGWRRDGVVFDLDGQFGLAFNEEQLVLWMMPGDGGPIAEAIVPAPATSNCHFVAVMDHNAIALFIDGVEVKRVPVHCLPQHVSRESYTRYRIARSFSGSPVKTCPFKLRCLLEGRPCSHCVSMKARGVVPAKGSIGTCRIYVFALTKQQVHLVYLTAKAAAASIPWPRAAEGA